jgi:hypothetical protein
MRQLFFGTQPVTRVLRAGTFVVLLGLAPAVGRADVIIGNLGAADGNSLSFNGSSWDAASFTMGSQAYSLADVQITLTSNPASSSTFVLESDASGVPSGTVVSTFSTHSPDFTNSTTTYTFTPDSAFTLAANTTYWLVASTTSGGSGGSDSIPVTFPAGGGATFGNYATSTSSGSAWTIDNSNAAKFQIDGTLASVPEPSSLLLVGTVACVAAAVGWRRRRTGRLEQTGASVERGGEQPRPAAGP